VVLIGKKKKLLETCRKLHTELELTKSHLTDAVNKVILLRASPSLRHYSSVGKAMRRVQELRNMFPKASFFLPFLLGSTGGHVDTGERTAEETECDLNQEHLVSVQDRAARGAAKDKGNTTTQGASSSRHVVVVTTSTSFPSHPCCCCCCCCWSAPTSPTTRETFLWIFNDIVLLIPLLLPLSFPSPSFSFLFSFSFSLSLSGWGAHG